MSYVAPLKDMLFVMNELADLAAINALPGCEAVSYTHLTLPTILLV